MSTNVEKLGPARAKLTIEVPFADLKPHLDKAYRDIAANVTVPGFRKGKVPPAIIDQRFGRGAVLQEAINASLPEAYSAAIAESGLVPLGEPEIDITKLEDGELVEFTAEVDVRPEFELPDFSELSAEVAPLADTESEVNERIEIMRQRFATRSDVDRKAKKGDVVTINLVGTKDGETLEDAEASDVAYKVGSEGMLDGLDKAVTGLKAGDEVDFTSTLIGGASAGTEANIHVTVTKVQEETLPEVDDEFAQMISQFDTVEEMKADLTEAVVRMARLDQLNSARDKVLEQLVEKVDLPLPEGMEVAQNEARKQQITDQLARAGYTVERYLEEAEDEEAKTADEFWAEIERRTSTALKAQIILDKLADDNEFGVEQEELTEMLFRRAAQNGTSPEQEMQHMMEHNHTGEWMAEIRRNKALQLVVSQASVVDTDGNVVNAAAVKADGSIDESVEAPAPAKKPAAKKPAKKAPAKKADADAKPAEAEAEKAEDAEEKAPAKKAPAKKPAAKKAPAKKEEAEEKADAEKE